MVMVPRRVKRMGNDPCTVISPDMETREVTASSEGTGNTSVKGPRIKACLCSILNALFFAQFITPAEPFARSSLSFSSFCVFLCTSRNATIVFRTPVLDTFYSTASLSAASACYHHQNQAILTDMGDHLEEHLKP
ncbi:unnamed protein product [Ectocarpus sp. 12 AP-2014]